MIDPNAVATLINLRTPFVAKPERFFGDTKPSYVYVKIDDWSRAEIKTDGRFRLTSMPTLITRDLIAQFGAVLDIIQECERSVDK